MIKTFEGTQASWYTANWWDPTAYPDEHLERAGCTKEVMIEATQ